MGKKKKPSSDSLGRAIIRAKVKSRNARGTASDRHTTDVNDGYDWGRLNLQSVTEESSFEQFLSIAELAGTEFKAEKLNIKFVNPKSGVGLLSADQKRKVAETQDKNKNLLGIPRRPPWDENTTAEELQAAEKQAFLDWRRKLAMLQEVEGVVLTPYEKNLEFWRQLWRVLERSDVVVQIVDARNPLLFRCEDLEQYVRELSPHKMNMLLLNKADFLTQTQRQAWADYFGSIGVRIAFFSATQAERKVQKVEEEGDEDEEEDGDEDEEESGNEADSEAESPDNSQASVELEPNKASDSSEMLTSESQNIVADSEAETPENSGTDTEESNTRVTNSDALLSREQLVALFKCIHTGPKTTAGITTIGLVGYPNVGKSSTINTLLTYKKVSVSATPGKTKHFQTLYLESDLMLCDCPGLVMPSFVFTKAEMVVNGILPIDQMRDHVPPVNLVTSLIPRSELEYHYGIILPPPMEGEDPTRPPTSEELLNAYGFNRGFMTQNGQPDNPRSARYVLKDFVQGKLLYCHAPPGYDQEQYHKFPERRRKHESAAAHVPLRVSLAVKPNRVCPEDLDQQFFQKASIGVHKKGDSSSASQSSGSSVNVSAKPWKDHSNKRNKREKLRRVYAHLDQ